jgi:predicted GNAT family acetyltransferase
MDTAVHDNTEASRYELDTGSGLAIMTYQLDGDVITILHTEAPPATKGVGGILARAVLDDVKKRGLKVVPECPFVKRFIEKNEQYQGLLA